MEITKLDFHDLFPFKSGQIQKKKKKKQWGGYGDMEFTGVLKKVLMEIPGCNETRSVIFRIFQKSISLTLSTWIFRGFLWTMFLGNLLFYLLNIRLTY